MGASPNIEGGQILLYAGITLLVFLAFLCLKKIFLRVWLQKNFLIFPPLEISTISSIAMIIATNTAVIFTIVFLTNNLLGVIFQIYPGSRLLIETILIKIGGALYGPAIGMLIGLLTDLLTVILTSSVFNGGYLLAAIFNGFFGGFIFMLTSTRNRKSLSYWQNTFLVFCMLAITSVVFYLFYSDTFKSSQDNGELKVNIFSQEVKFPQWFFPAFLSSLLGIICLSLTGTLFLSTRERSETLSRKCKKWNTIIRIVAMNFLSYILVDLITLPLFDIKLSTLPYEQFFIMRNVLLIPAVAFSSLIIWKIFKLNKKLQFTESKRVLIPLPAGARTGALIRCNPNLKY